MQDHSQLLSCFAARRGTRDNDISDTIMHAMANPMGRKCADCAIVIHKYARVHNHHLYVCRMVLWSPWPSAQTTLSNSLAVRSHYHHGRPTGGEVRRYGYFAVLAYFDFHLSEKARSSRQKTWGYFISSISHFFPI